MSISNTLAFGHAIPLRVASLPTPERGLVLIIADDDELAAPMRLELENAGFAVHVARSKDEGLIASRSRDAAAIIVDRMGDGVEGLLVVEELRASGDHTPLLAVGVPESVEERITYIRSGADDYLTRPFDLREMTARVEALLRRRRDERAAVLEVGSIEMDLVKRVVRCMGRRVDLLPREFTLLEYFARHPRQILSREKLLEDVWRSRAYGRTNVVDVQVGNLRRKLDPTGERRFIVSVRGAGFRLEPAGLD
jgi:two-component system, OmpR family, response regulator